jgi:hypothetical protein
MMSILSHNIDELRKTIEIVESIGRPDVARMAFFAMNEIIEESLDCDRNPVLREDPEFRALIWRELHSIRDEFRELI